MYIQEEEILSEYIFSVKSESSLGGGFCNFINIIFIFMREPSTLISQFFMRLGMEIRGKREKLIVSRMDVNLLYLKMHEKTFIIRNA